MCGGLFFKEQEGISCSNLQGGGMQVTQSGNSRLAHGIGRTHRLGDWGQAQWDGGMVKEVCALMGPVY